MVPEGAKRRYVIGDLPESPVSEGLLYMVNHLWNYYFTRVPSLAFLHLPFDDFVLFVEDNVIWDNSCYRQMRERFLSLINLHFREE